MPQQESLSNGSVIALGANLPSDHGTPVDTLEYAVALITDAGLRITARSPWYATSAWPEGAGPDFVNGAISVAETDGPALLAHLHRIEAALGRTRKAGRWDARVCDLDLLCVRQTVLPDASAWHAIADAPPETPRPSLVLPHPLLHTRAFVLVPMADVVAEWRHPILGKTTRQMRDALPADEIATVRRLPG